MIQRLIDWLMNGSDELVMSKSWLANRDRLRLYDHYTKRQRFQGAITADVDEMRRRDFWEAVAAKAQRTRKSNVAEFPRVSER